ncbi:hypothetical protein PTTG_06306 [Puccinia triticina 1-1 BBBD Race 1]|uniref:Uncharacterized protein n=2 Tax=Puccinia triticina TaxID=208348 RepID=A0A0C4EZP6_PUCT1|nr:uncharacterized protein PtA15_3A165 [Puccinia triticina]OAV96306.1 hypothetical protein PTTG_06306 [Puccinia triticina 1-1 BBBD Race 1]WAQ82801.1 hypothetical protein PtA15_3A165 [Puccinia triticina]WAR53642.1 hypothetical protein PtB15_3B150 [Puccinia triticina]
MELLGYVFMNFLQGNLPWQGISAAAKNQMHVQIMESKMTTPTKSLCQGHPKEFAIYLNYTRLLGFNDKPDYPYLRRLFRNLCVCEGFTHNYVFDWFIKARKYNPAAAVPTCKQIATKDRDPAPTPALT